METNIKRTNIALTAVLTLFSLSSYAEKDVSVGAKLTQHLKVGADLILDSKGFGNTQGINLIRADGDVSIEAGGSIDQTLDLDGKNLELKQSGVATLQAANYIGARGSANLTGEVNQRVENAMDVSMTQMGHLSLQGVNVIESGASILPSEDLGGIKESVTQSVFGDGGSSSSDIGASGQAEDSAGTPTQ